jgi:hypothetical protein
LPLYGLKGRGALDILSIVDGKRIAIELKYCKARLDYEFDGEKYQLPPTVARDIFRYDVCKDITRLEHAVGSKQADLGYLIVLSNDPAMWLEQRYESIDAAFKLHHGRILQGDAAWTERAGPGTTKGRERTHCFAGEYRLTWSDYSEIGVRNGEFRVLVLSVFSGPATNVAASQIENREPSNRSLKRDLQAIRTYFRCLEKVETTMSFDEIETIFGELPASARNHAAWWQRVDSHQHAVWELEGWKASPRISERRVTFRKR